MFVKQKCNSSSTVQQTRILSSNVFGRKEKRGLSSSPRLKPTKYIYRNNPFQKGKSRHAKISHKPWRLHDKHRLDRRLSVCPNSSGISKIPSIYLAKQSLPIQSDALWTKCSSQGIHEAIKTGRSLASRPGNPSHNILRRHSDNAFLCRISKTTQTNNYSPSGIIRVPDKLRQVNVNPNSKDSIPRVVDRFDTNVVYSARNKNHVNSQSMSTACQQTTTNYSRSLTGTRPTRILPTGSVVSTVTLSSASRTSNKFTETVVRLRPTNTSDTSSQVGLIMVDKQSTLVERQSNTTSNYRYYDNIVIVITITYVASKMGWGASMGTLTTGGKWSQVEAQENLLKANYGRHFFVCSDQTNPCSFWAWGDVQAVAKPKCRHGVPSVIRKVKKETVNKDRLFFCCAQEDSCNYFEWVPEESYSHTKFLPSTTGDFFLNGLSPSYF